MEPYRFGSRTAEFLIADAAASDVGATCETPAGVRAVINVNYLDNRAAFIQQPVPLDHDLLTWRS